MALPVLTIPEIIDQLSSGSQWYSDVITYAIPTSSAEVNGFFEQSSFKPLSAIQAASFNEAIGLWADLIAPEVVNVGTGSADITVGNFYDKTGKDFAHTYYPDWSTVWFNSYYNGSRGGSTNNLARPVVGQHGFATYIHEIGHAFGLEHAGDYDAGDGGTPSPQSYQDSEVYSIMSYFGPGFGDGTDVVTKQKYSKEIAWGSWGGYDPQTPMLNDVLTIQNNYGVSTTTRTGDTVYGFHSNVTGAEASIYNFAVNKHPIMCIFDSSGTDTLDLSLDTHNDVIHLAAGSFSNVMGLTSNLSIAYSCTIENADGGKGNDTIVGNDAANRILGGAGNDIITGGAGADYLDGGSGTNTLNYASSADGVNINLLAHTASGGDAEGDTILNFTNVTGSATGANTLVGNASANVLIGGTGDDYIEGGTGNDKMTGGGGHDVFVFLAADSGHDEITDFSLLLDQVTIARTFATKFSALHFANVSGGATLTLHNEVIKFDHLTVAQLHLHPEDFVFV